MACILCKESLVPMNGRPNLDHGKKIVRVQCGHICHWGCVVQMQRSNATGVGLEGGISCPACSKPIIRRHLSRVILPRASSAAENGPKHTTTGPCKICDKLAQENRGIREEISRDNAALKEKTKEADVLESQAKDLHRKNCRVKQEIKKIEAMITALESESID